MSLKETYEKYKHFSALIHDIKKTQKEIDAKENHTDNLLNHIMCDCFIAIEKEVTQG
jgi:hypothetical protein